MKAIVTGGTGLLGSNLVRQLVEQGHQVKVLARSTEKAKKILGNLDITVVEGDMAEVERFAPELEGVDVLFHTAAYFREYYEVAAGSDPWQTLEKINVKATLQLLGEAEARGVGKVIYVSSSGVIGNRSDGQPADESTPPGPFQATNLYFKSKVVAEEAIAEFLKSHRLPVVLILPGWMFGPSDSAPTAAGQLVLDFMRSKLPGIIDGRSILVDARDVAQAMIEAVEHGKSGERYIVGGNFTDFEKIALTIEKTTGVKAPRFHIPYRLGLLIAFLSETSARLRKKPTLITVGGLRTLHDGTPISSEKAQRELGVKFRSLEETLGDTANWYRQHDYLT